MNLERKQAIREKLIKYCEEAGGQRAASEAIPNISYSTVNKIVNGERVSEESYIILAGYLDIDNTEWNNVHTTNFKILQLLLQNTQDHSNVIAVTGGAGSGKSIATKIYTKTHDEAYKITCTGYWNKSIFLSEILKSLGRRSAGMSVAEMIREIVRQLKQKHKPILILDEADKLADAIMYFFITLYNELEDHCGIVLIATNYLEKRIKKGLMVNKKGYQEIYSRIGRKFIELKGVNSSDVFAICQANGVKDKGQIKQVWNDCEMDLRRVKRKIHALKQKSA